MLWGSESSEVPPKGVTQMNQLKTDIAKLRKVAEEVAAYIKELGRELDDCVEAINNKQPAHDDWRKIKTIEEADAIAAEARARKNSIAVAIGGRNKNRNRLQKVKLAPACRGGSTSAISDVLGCSNPD
jgi:uncharacterized coiled-coil DUF342 family protein